MWRPSSIRSSELAHTVLRAWRWWLIPLLLAATLWAVAAHLGARAAEGDRQSYTIL